MAISYKYNLLFIHIPKNAGTSIIDYLEMKPHGHFKWNTHPDFNNNSLYKFSIIRNPWDRVVSNYLYSKMENSYWHSVDGNSIHGIHPDYHLLKNKTFQECVDMLYDDRSLFKHEGWNLQSDYIYDKDVLKVDELIKLEDLYVGLKNMFLKLNLDINNNIFHLNKSNTKNYIEYYSNNELIEKVNQIYKKDIKKLNYNYGT